MIFVVEILMFLNESVEIVVVLKIGVHTHGNNGL